MNRFTVTLFLLESHSICQIDSTQFRITLHVLSSNLRSITMFPPLLRSLHWLPITKSIDYELSTIRFSVMNGTGPEYLPELLTTYTPYRQLRSASDTRLFGILSFKTKTNGQRSFSFQKSLLSGTLSLKLFDIPHPSPHSSLLQRHTCSVSKRKTSRIFVSTVRSTLLELFLFLQLSELKIVCFFKVE